MLNAIKNDDGWKTALKKVNIDPDDIEEVDAYGYNSGIYSAIFGLEKGIYCFVKAKLLPDHCDSIYYVIIYNDSVVGLRRYVKDILNLQ